ncbi:hypothetical protein DY000_02023493 [Brassica cretica]|uniref:Uncharacterized protein n=1 Tax=Brassica cretica TaxID=69181 RepID=A0ABQ7E7E3_BRACR|nr:hypothetical protein DY000_02023493 [Brassica cretica]
MHGFVSYRRFGRARSLRNDQAVFVLCRYVATGFGLSSVATYRPSHVRARPLRSDRALARARSLRSDRAAFVLGHYVATELWLEIGRYEAEKQCSRHLAEILSRNNSDGI